MCIIYFSIRSFQLGRGCVLLQEFRYYRPLHARVKKITKYSLYQNPFSVHVLFFVLENICFRSNAGFCPCVNRVRAYIHNTYVYILYCAILWTQYATIARPAEIYLNAPTAAAYVYYNITSLPKEYTCARLQLLPFYHRTILYSYPIDRRP